MMVDALMMSVTLLMTIILSIAINEFINRKKN